MADNRILIVDDDAVFRRLIRVVLEKERFDVTEATGGSEAIELLHKNRFDIVILDYIMTGDNGLETLDKIKRLELAPRAEFILITAFGDDKVGLEAVRRGCFDFIAKPFNFANLVFRVRRALEKIETDERLEILSQPRLPGFEEMIGDSEGMRKIFRIIKQIADKDTTILIEGETGTGKELVAKSIHANSRRKNSVYIPLTCSSLSENLLESELFGYEKGAFTGAAVRKYGILETANHGTVMLDEINSASLNVQAKLLRFIETNEFMRVGGNTIIRCDARIIAASNQPLALLVGQKLFREDLFHRLNIVRIMIPPLRERPEDIPLLVRHFLAFFNKKFGCDVKIRKFVLDTLVHYTWPGNIRQLKNTVQSLILLNTTGHIEPGDLPDSIRDSTPVFSLRMPFKDQKEKMIREFEVRYLMELVKETCGNVSKASRIAGLNRKNLIAKLSQFGIDPGRFKRPGGRSSVPD